MSMNSLKMEYSSLRELAEYVLADSKIYDNPYISLKVYVRDNMFVKEIKQRFIKATAYSTLLIGIALLMLSYYVFGFRFTMRDLLMQFDASINSLITDILLYIVLVSWVIGFVVLIVLLLCYRIFYVFFWISSSRISESIRVFNTWRYIVMLDAINSITDDANETFKYLSTWQGNVHLKWLNGLAVETMLKHGRLFNPVNTSIFDSRISYFTASKQGIDISQVKKSYEILASSHLNQRFKVLTMVMKFIAIIMVILTLIVFYSALLQPLKIMEGL